MQIPNPSVILLLAFSSALAAENEENYTDRRHLLLVNTTSGLIRGVEQLASNGKPIWLYLGVPYVEPPTGKTRFLPPEKVQRRDGILVANQQPNSCIQNSYPATDLIPALKKFELPTPISEDCLYLNIYKPATDVGAPKTGRTVMVWIYGGAYTKGTISFSTYDGSVMANEEGVIVVAINYRLTALGYLYLDHPGVPGNAGLYDQLYGIAWVKENIAAFGGDPDKITVYGESAGATSTALLLISPENRGLFHRGILESGSSTVPWGTLDADEALRRSLGAASELGCIPQINDTKLTQLELFWRRKATSAIKESVVACLLNVKAEDFLDHEPDVVDSCSFAPVVDGRILPKKPLELLKDRTDSTKQTNQKHPLQIMMGSNANEGTLFFLYFLPGVFSIFEETAFLERKDLSETIRMFSPLKFDEILETMEFFYADWKQLSQPKFKMISNGNISLEAFNFQDSLDELVSDYFFTCRMKDTANAIDSSFHVLDLRDNSVPLPDPGHGPAAYVYQYEHRSSVTLFPAWMGVFHSHELEFVFGEPLYVGATAPKYNAKEKLFGKRMLRLWANFARTGNPNASPDGKEELMENVPRWPKWSSKNQEYMRLSAKNIGPGVNLRARECLLWDSFLPNMLKRSEHYNKTIAFYKTLADTAKNHNHINAILDQPEPNSVKSSPSTAPDNSSTLSVLLGTIIIMCGFGAT